MLFFRSNFFKGSETDLNKLVQKQLALNSTRVTLESSQATIWFDVLMPYAMPGMPSMPGRLLNADEADPNH